MSKALELLESMEKLATPGPWRLDWDEATPPRLGGIVSGPEGEDEFGAPAAVRIVETDSGYYPPKTMDAALIVTLRNALPSILELIRAARVSTGEVKEWTWASAGDVELRAALAKLEEAVKP